jgi:hypothetical protein
MHSILAHTALALSLAAAPAARDTAPPEAPVTIALEPYGSGPLRTVKVVVAGDTLDFLMDTGGGVTIVSPAIAAKLGCTPSGRSSGYRLTGERLESKVCRDVPLTVGAGAGGGWRTTVEASVSDIMRFLGPGAPPVHGMISLRTFERQAITLDQAGGTLVVESPRSLERRVRGTTPLRARLATGLQGGQLDLFVGVQAGGSEHWLLWDSGNQAPTLVAPALAEALGLGAEPGGDVPLALASGLSPLASVRVKREMIHDGVLSTWLVRRAVWTVDLARGRMWVGAVAPLLAAPSAAAAPTAQTAPTADPTGWYDVTLVVKGDRQRAVMRVDRDGAGLAARLRFLGEETTFELRDVALAGSRLSFGLPMREVYPVRLDFSGTGATGTWGDPAAFGGAAEATKRGG